MVYLISLLVVAGALVVLTVLLVWLIGPVRRLMRTVQDCRAAIAERIDLLVAHAAAVRREFDRRRSHRKSYSDA
ncbi:MAG: hypothetical protein M3308_05320 [Actinomycetota bacterium]|nr:hypothetical protein [Actinomycetota bacterium]